MLLVIAAMIADFSEDWWMKSHVIVFVVVLIVFNFNVMAVRRTVTVPVNTPLST